jgi:hypothetical protein
MRVREILSEAAIDAISPQQAQGMFGPLYHGTKGDLSAIIASGVDISHSIPKAVDLMNRPLGISNGYAFEPYGYTGIAPPIHHLGYGFYTTTVKSIAKQFAGGSLRGMRTFYLDSSRVLTINFGSPRTMMQWWRENGYDMTSEATKASDFRAWQAATFKLTFQLSKNHDAVWFKGKGIHKLLDGDQVCVYNTDLLRVVDPKLATGVEVGSKVVHTQVIPSRFKGSNIFYVDDLKASDFGNAGKLAGSGWRAIFRGDEEPHPNVGRYPIHFIPPSGMIGIITPFQTNGKFSVKWTKGGEMFNYEPEELQPKV